MERNKFKIGDWITMIQDYSGDIHKGETYRITGLQDAKNDWWYIENNTGEARAPQANRDFRHATPEEIKKVQGSDLDIDKEFVLPKKWCVRDCKEVSKWAAEKFDCEEKVQENSYLHIDPKSYNFFTEIHKDYTKITFDQFKKYVLKQVETSLKVEDLVEGEIYTATLEDYDLEYTFRVTNKKGGYNSCVWNRGFSWSADAIDWVGIKLANFSNIKWLNACIAANKFISKEEALKKEVKFEVGKWYKVTDNHLKVIGNNIWIIKFLEKNENGIIRSSEHFNNNQIIQGGNFGTLKDYNFTEVSLSEIQQYLPEGHIDKVVEKWSVGTWVVFLSNKIVSNPGASITKGKPYCIATNFDTELHWINDDKNKPYNFFHIKEKIEWFSTKQEAEEFSKSLTQKEMKFKVGDKVKFISKEGTNAAYDIGDILIVKELPTLPSKFIKCRDTIRNLPQSVAPNQIELYTKPIIDKMGCPYDEGTPISCYIEGTFVEDAKVHYEDGNIFICQNIKSGLNACKQPGYKYTWCVVQGNNSLCNNWVSGIHVHKVTEVRNKSLDLIYDSIDPETSGVDRISETLYHIKDSMSRMYLTTMTTKSKVKRIEIYTESTPVVVVEEFIPIRKVNKVKTIKI
jgi:hypothetical protein